MKTVETMLCNTEIEFAVIMLNDNIMFEGHVRDLQVHSGIKLLRCECRVRKVLFNVFYISLNEQSFYENFN